MNSSSFINEIKQLFQVYLISVFIRNFVVDIQTKNERVMENTSVKYKMKNGKKTEFIKF